MIDISKCVFGESYRDEAWHREVYFFDYPKDLSLADFTLDPNENVVSMCIELIVYDDGRIEMSISPTVEEEDSFFDVDWCPLEDGVHISYDDADKLIALANDTIDFSGVKMRNEVLEDDGSPYGGVAFFGETVRDFLDFPNRIHTLSELNAALKACGIKPVSPE